MTRVQVQINTIFIPRNNDGDEDAEPICYYYKADESCIFNKKTYVILGVFDGLGGRGALPHTGEKGRRTQAWYAAREAKKIIEDKKDQYLKFNSQFLQELISKGFQARFSASSLSSSGKLRGSLLPNTQQGFPTTMAIACVDLQKELMNVFWAGDSRCYWITTDKGLQCLTPDDCNTKNLLTIHFEDDGYDPKMNNVISLDKFKVNEICQVSLTKDCMVFACSDGFYDLEDPIKFMFSLYENIVSSDNFNEFIRNMSNKSKALQNDDISASFLFLGEWPSFKNNIEALLDQVRGDKDDLDAKKTNQKVQENNRIELNKQINLLQKIEKIENEVEKINDELNEGGNPDSKKQEMVNKLLEILAKPTQNLQNLRERRWLTVSQVAEIATEIKNEFTQNTLNEIGECLDKIIQLPSLEELIEQKNRERDKLQNEIRSLKNDPSFVSNKTINQLQQELIKLQDQLEKEKLEYKIFLYSLWTKYERNYLY